MVGGGSPLPPAHSLPSACARPPTAELGLGARLLRAFLHPFTGEISSPGNPLPAPWPRTPASLSIRPLILTLTRLGFLLVKVADAKPPELWIWNWHFRHILWSKQPRCKE